MTFKNILVFSFSFIGDAILSTCVIAPLKQHSPDASITFLTGPAAAHILDGEPRIDQVLIYDNKQKHAGGSGKWRLIRELRSRQFDLIVDLRDSFWSRLVGKPRWGLTNRARQAHAVVRYLSTLEPHGLECQGAVPKITPTPQEIQRAQQRMGTRQTRYRVALHPGGNWSYKQWPVANFAELADLLAGTLDAEIFLIGGPQESAITRQIVKQMKDSPIVFNEISLRDVAAVISLCDHYVGNDTGPMHLAAAVGTPVTALFGPTDHQRSGPYGPKHHVLLSEKTLGCQPCHPGRHPGGCGRGTCEVLDSIPVIKAFETVRTRINIV